MSSEHPPPLAAELHEAEETLKSSLSEACGSDPARADTGELIRIEEVLAIASDAAKRAISIRRRKRTRRSAAEAAEAEVPLPTAASRTMELAGTTWTVRAVHPTQGSSTAHSRLRGSYQHGWLAFESEGGKRRLSPIPDGWDQCDGETLRAFWLQADEVRGRGR